VKDVIYDLSMINSAMLIEHEAYYVKNEKKHGRLDPHMLYIIIHHSEAANFLTCWQYIPYLTTWWTHTSMDVICYEVRICYPTSQLRL
jgi:hypothetical protein